MANQTALNNIANTILKRKYDDLGINHCEIGQHFQFKSPFDRCTRKRQGYAHDAKRIDYKADPTGLFAVKHTLSACNNCHTIIEGDREMTSLLFKELRSNMAEPKTRATQKTKDKFKSKKVEWMRPHKCIHCHKMLTGLLCSCGELSTK